MALSKEQVVAALAKVPAPDGTPLPQTGTLSDVVVTDGKVFFSLTVDAAAVKAWEPVRKRAEDAVRAIPGVQSALVALTAERAGGAARPAPAPAAGRAPHAHAHGGGGGATQPGIPGRRMRSSRSRRARAASANRPRRSILRSACAILD